MHTYTVVHMGPCRFKPRTRCSFAVEWPNMLKISCLTFISLVVSCKCSILLPKWYYKSFTRVMFSWGINLQVHLYVFSVIGKTLDLLDAWSRHFFILSTDLIWGYVIRSCSSYWVFLTLFLFLIWQLKDFCTNDHLGTPRPYSSQCVKWNTLLFKEGIGCEWYW